MNPAITRALKTAPDEWPAGLAVEHLERVDSTNRALLDTPFAPRPQPDRLLWATEQTAGRGRRGRNWLAEPGRSLAFSLATEQPAAPVTPSIALAVGVALAEALAPLCGPLALKWPNDLLREHAKCGGILVESRRGGRPEARIDRCVIGVGLNLLAPLDPMRRIDQSAGGLFENANAMPDPHRVLVAAARAVLTALAEHRAQGFSPFMARFDRLHAWTGRPVRALDDGRLIAEGVVTAVADDGALLLQTTSGTLRLVAGELSLRPA